MAEKKRKVGAAAAPPPAKKSKKSTPTESVKTENPEPANRQLQSTTTNEAATKSRSSRKRAADFLGEQDVPAAEASEPAQLLKTGKKSKKEPTFLTADGANGVVEKNVDASVKIVSSKSPVDSSLEAEGLRTAEHELQEENADEDEDQGATLLAGFDSDGEDLAEDQGDTSKIQPIPQYKKTSKKLKQAREKGGEEPGAVYIGRIPHGFYEQQMREYFTQFGPITRLRLSRNKKTGASKHFAFIEFESDEVAKIVAETMDNYLMYGHILKCKYALTESLHPDVWKGANKKYRKIPHTKLQRQQLQAPKTQEQWSKKNEKERKKRQNQAERLKAIGYEYIIPELEDPAKVVESRNAEVAHGIPATISTSDAHPDAIAAPPAVPADEVELKKEKEKKSLKKVKNSGGVREALTEGNLKAQNDGRAAESAKIANIDNDKSSTGATVATSVPATVSTSTSQKSSSKKKSKSSGDSTKENNSAPAPGSSHGIYDELSSIPVGVEAAPASVTDRFILDQSATTTSILDTISTENGVADAVLAGRKSDRKREKKATDARKHAKDKAAVLEEMEKVAPGAMQSNGHGVEGKKLKGILKKGKK